jgi:pilus assembly protein Flp/PilA
MKKLLLNVRHTLVGLHREESGQDLIEYALIAALIALAATVGMGSVAKAINTAFSSIGQKLTNYAS